MTPGILDLEVAFTTDPAANPVWTSLSNRIRRFETFRGRQRARGKFETGTLRVVLDNRDRALDPFNSASPYAPNVVPNRRVRAMGRLNGPDAPKGLFTGYVNAWPPEWDVRDGTVKMDASGAFKIVARQSLPMSVWAYEVMEDNPVLWWRMGEGQGTTAIDTSGTGNDGTYFNGATFNSRESLVVGHPDGAILFESNQYLENVTRPFSDYPFGIEFWLRMPEVTRNVHNIFAAPGISASTGTVHGGQLVVALSNGPDVRQVKTLRRIDDDRPHHIFVAARSAFLLEVYIDGSLASVVPTTFGTGAPSIPAAGSYGIRISSPTFSFTDSHGVVTTFDFGIGATVDEFVVYAGTVPSADRIARHQSAGVLPWDDDRPHSRIVKVLNAIGWPEAERVVDSSSVILGQTELKGNPLAYLERIAETEQGAFYEDRDGRLRFRSRYALTAAPRNVVQATFTDGLTPGFTYEAAHPTIRYDDIVNIARLGSESGGRVEEVTDPSSVARYWPEVYEKTDLMQRDPADLRAVAQHIVNRGREPAAEFDLVDLSSDGGPDIVQQIIDRDLEDLVVIEKTPPQTGVGSTTGWPGFNDAFAGTVVSGVPAGPIVSRRARIQGIRIIVDATGNSPNYWSCRWWLSSIGVPQVGEAEFWVVGTGAVGRVKVGF